MVSVAQRVRLPNRRIYDDTDVGTFEHHEKDPHGYTHKDPNVFHRERPEYSGNEAMRAERPYTVVDEEGLESV